MMSKVNPVPRISLRLEPPRHYLHLCAASKARLQRTMDEFGDPYFECTEEEDLRQVTRAETTVKVETTLTIPPPSLRRSSSTWSHRRGGWG